MLFLIPKWSWALQPDSVQVKNSFFNLQYSPGGISSLKRTDDAYDTDYVLKGHQLGNVIIRFRKASGPWITLSTLKSQKEGNLKTDFDRENNTFMMSAQKAGIRLEVQFRLNHKKLFWNINVDNTNAYPVEVGDIALPQPMNHDWSNRASVTYNKRVIRHLMISGNNSFLFWMRCNTQGPYLLMTPQDHTSLEYYDQSTKSKKGPSVYTVYIHSKAQGQKIKQHDGTWRQPHTSITLAAQGHERDSWKAGFILQWAKNYSDVRSELYREGLFNIKVEPGMTVPVETKTKVALKNKRSINRIDAEYPNQTIVRSLGTRNHYHIYGISFKKLGENKLTINYGNGRTCYLEYFVTQPIATLIKKRAQFLTNREQIKNSDKWYEGLFSDWSMKNEWLLKPDSLYDISDGRRYMVSSDDPSLGRPAFLAKKNVTYPVQKQVSALDYYIDHYVWGGLQMTGKEAYPYAIYGIYNWIDNRQSDDQGQYGQTHIWRIYDYPHIIQMYLSMYRIAEYYPGIHTQLKPEKYLQRAYGTAAAFYTIPKEVIGWSAYNTGNYNEIAILGVIKELEKAGEPIRANRLRQNWEKKVQRFVDGDVNLFASEYPYDTTGFESTGAFARYAMSVAGRASKKYDMLPLNITKKQAWHFMKQQVAVNVGTRGWLEKAYYLYGSDYRGGGNATYLLSYMAQMGGESLLDYALYFAPDPYKYLRLSYGSILSSWALMNTGTPESNYGYWYPGEKNDGGAGGGFEPLAYATNWLGLSQSRGSWYYGCEIDLGFTGYLRAAATVVAKDPVFGMTVFGGRLKQNGTTVKIIPEDGVRRRLHFLWDQQKVHVSLDYGHFKAHSPIFVNQSFKNMTFELEKTGYKQHSVNLHLKGLPKGTYAIKQGHKRIHTLEADSAEKEIMVHLSVKSSKTHVEISRINS